MPSGNDYIKAALKEIGALGIGETPSASEQSEGLTTLNAMIDSWNTRRLRIHAITIADYALVTTQQSYTLGSGGNFNQTRPTKIESAAILMGDAGGTPANDKVRLPLTIINSRQWQALKMQRATSTIPEKMYPDYARDANARMTVYFWPIPTFSGTTAPRVEFTEWTILAAFAAATSVTLPAGYQRAIELNLAIELAPQYGRPITQDLDRNAQQALAALEAFNATLPFGDPPPPVGALQVPPPGSIPPPAEPPPTRGA